MARALLAGFVVLAAAVTAGCMGPDASGSTDASEPIIVMSPDDYSYLANNSTSLADREHVHDYWGGKTRLVVLDEEKEDGSSLLNDPVIVTFRPEKPIPLGASHVDVQLAWTTDLDDYYLATELWVKTAAQEEVERVDVVESGTPVRVATTNAQNDIPHQGISSWEFQLRFYGDRDAQWPLTFKQWDGTVSAHIEAVRGLDIPPFPAHPDLWQNGTALPLVTGYVFNETTALGPCLNCDSRLIRPDAHALVPPDASHVGVTLTVDHDAGIAANQIRLLYHGADSREWQEAPEVESDDTRTLYRIPVQQNGDSPYAQSSLWEFYATYEGKPVPARTFSGSWYVDATVHRGGE